MIQVYQEPEPIEVALEALREIVQECKSPQEIDRVARDAYTEICTRLKRPIPIGMHRKCSDRADSSLRVYPRLATCELEATG